MMTRRRDTKRMAPTLQFAVILCALLRAEAFVTTSPAQGATKLPVARTMQQQPSSRSLGVTRMSGMDNLAELDALLRTHSPQRCLSLLKKLDESDMALDKDRAAELLSQIGNAVLMSVDGDTLDGNMSASSSSGSSGTLHEEDLSYLYNELHKRGLLNAYGSVSMDVVPYTNKDMTAEKLEELTGLNMKALAPGKSDNAWAYAGAAICVAEAAAAQYYGVDPLQVVIPATIGVFALDRIVFRGALFESVARFVNPTYKDKIMRHEAGHFLLAYLMGCPVTGCLLDPWQVQKYVRGGQGGTVFADPSFARGIESGSLSKSAVDRFSIILMAGIAAEAQQFGKAEGGGVDESTLIDILSSIQPPFTYEMIRRQARWAAVQAVLLIKEHQSAYDALLEAIQQNASLGVCVMAIETALEQQRQQQPISPVQARRNALAASKGVTLDSESARLRKTMEEAFKRNEAQRALDDNQRVADELSHRLKSILTNSIPDDISNIASGDINQTDGGMWLRGVGGRDIGAIDVTQDVPTISRISSSINDKSDMRSQVDKDAEMARIEARLSEVNARLQEMQRQSQQQQQRQQ